MKYSIRYLLFILSLCFCTGVHAQTGSGTNVTVLTFDQYDHLQYGQNVQLSFSVYYDFSTCPGNMNLDITLPASVQTNAATVSFAPEVINAIITDIVSNTNGTKTVKIQLTPGLIPTTIFTSTVVYLQNIAMPLNGCGSETIPVAATLTTSTSSNQLCNAATDELDLTIISNDPVTIELQVDNQQNNIDYQHGVDPFSAMFTIYKNALTVSQQEKFEVSMDIGSSAMAVKAVALMNDRGESREISYNIQYVDFQQTGSIITFRTPTDVSALTWKQISFRIYFDLSCSAASQQTFTANISVIPYSSCTHLAGTPLTLSRNYEYTCFDDNDIINKPAISVYDNGGSCTSNCNQAFTLMEIDNVHNSNSYATLDYVLDINDNMILTSINAQYPWGQNPSDLQATSLSYKLCGSPDFISAASANMSFPCGTKVDAIKISYTNFLAGHSADVFLRYKSDDKNCLGEPLLSTPGPLASYFVLNNATSPAKPIHYAVYDGCNDKVIVERIQNIPSSFSFASVNTVVQINTGAVHYIDFSFTNLKGSFNNDTYTYKLNQNLNFASQEILLLVSTSSEPGNFDSYKDVDAARAAFPELAAFEESFNGNNLVLSNFNLVNNCSNCGNDNQIKYIHVLIRAKPSLYPLAGIFQNAFENCGLAGLTCQMGQFSLQPSVASASELYVVCEEDVPLKNSDIRLNQDFSYSFVFINKGNTAIRDIVTLFNVPAAGSLLTYSTTSSNSEFGIPLKCGSDVLRAYEIGPDNVVVTTNVPITVDYISSTPLCPEDFNVDVTSSSCESATVTNNWSSACNAATAKTIRFRTGQGFVLGPYNRLVIQYLFHTPSNVALGKRASQNFVARGTYVQGENTSNKTDLLFSNIVTLTLAKRASCEPPECKECVSSFAPERNQKYILSGWVKETYTGLTPVNYVNSGIRLGFNEASILLPIMKASGPMVDGWQRIESTFVVPADADNIEVQLLNINAPGDVFFDDIRIHPFESNMKSFVYNPSTQKLVAELDENNYATLYEYDDEGILIRVKKETERGVMTIKETRMNQSKIKPVGQ